jgi:EAL and modified HD-GYP domain-containing signal transduction protein
MGRICDALPRVAGRRKIRPTYGLHPPDVHTSYPAPPALPVPRSALSQLAPTSSPAISPSSAPLPTVHLGRQAIYDSSLHSRAYEVFYRAAPTALPSPPPTPDPLSIDPERATCSLVLSAFAELGLERVASKKRVFLDVSHDVISGALPLPVSPEIVVLQVRDYEHGSAELASALGARRAEGFQVALKGFVLSSETEPLLAVASYLEFDLRRLGSEGLVEQLERVRGRGLQTMACNIDSPEQFNACVAAGCDLYQGRFLFRPQLLSHKRLPKSLETVTTLLRRLRDPSVELAELERITKTDPALSVAVLGFFGSAAHALANPVTSIAQAVSLMGLREFAKWITLVALTSTRQRPSELVLVALIRARACETLAASIRADADAAFTVGLMSMLEPLFERPAGELLDALPLAPEIKAAVSRQVGVLGDVLADVLAREQEDAEPRARFDSGSVNRAWLEAIDWAAEAQSALR